MTTARPILWALLGALFAVPAAPAAAQGAEMLAELRDLCVDDPERESINLAIDTGPAFAPLVEGGVPGWGSPGYFVYASIGEENAYYTPWQRSIVPLSSVTANIGRARGIWFSCPNSEDCIFKEGNTLHVLDNGPLFRTLTLGCRNPERVLQLLDAWIDRNVTRTPGVPPFTE